MPIKDVQKTHKQHAVPQNIMDVEFKIIGDLTMRQFFYLLIFGGLAYVSFMLLRGNIFRLPATIFCGFTGVVLAFMPLEDRGLDQWIVNFFKSVYKPNQRIWRKELIVPTAFSYTQNLSVVRQELITLAPTSSRRKLEEYLGTYEKGEEIDPLDIPIQEYVEKAHMAFVHEVQAAPVTLEEPEIEIAPPPLEKLPPEEKPLEVKPEKPEEKEMPKPAAEKPIIPPPEARKVVPEKPAPPPPPPPQIEKLELKMPKPTRPLVPLTPDRHTGRRFTSLLPSQGNIVLPIRGERVLKTSAEIDIEKDIEEKTQQLTQLLEQIKQGDEFRKITSQQKTEAKPPVDTEAKELIEKIKEENQQLEEKINKLNARIQQTQEGTEEKQKAEQELQKLKKEKEKSDQKYQELETKVKELEKELTEKKKDLPNVIVQKVYDTEPDQKQDEAQPPPPPTADVKPFTDKPNIISGIVRNSGGVAIPGVIAIIKNEKGEPVRALKTNSIGQFSITNPVSNGKYTIEIDKAGRSGQSFDIITIEAKGEVMMPIEFTGKEN